MSGKVTLDRNIKWYGRLGRVWLSKVSKWLMILRLIVLLFKKMFPEKSTCFDVIEECPMDSIEHICKKRQAEKKLKTTNANAEFMTL